MAFSVQTLPVTLPFKNTLQISFLKFTLVRQASSYTTYLPKKHSQVQLSNNQKNSYQLQKSQFQKFTSFCASNWPRQFTTGVHKTILKKFATFPPQGSLNTDINKIAEQLKNDELSNNVLVMAGAGLSTPSGIPDFRSPESGIYDNLQKYKLPYPEAIFDIEYYRGNPEPFNKWSKEFLPGVNYKPSIGHYFVRMLQDKGKLLRHFTQNIDGLELLAGVEEDKIVAAHGSFSSASCIYCKKAAELDSVKNTILADGIPHCEGNRGVFVCNVSLFLVDILSAPLNFSIW